MRDNRSSRLPMRLRRGAMPLAASAVLAATAVHAPLSQASARSMAKMLAIAPPTENLLLVPSHPLLRIPSN